MLGNLRLFAILCLSGAALAQAPESVYEATGPLGALNLPLTKLSGGGAHSVLFSVTSPQGLGAEARVAVSIVEGERVLLAKTLHAGDLDLYGLIRLASTATLRVVVEGGAKGTYRLQINRAPFAVVAGHRWQDAAPVRLGEVVTGASDEQLYVPLPGTPRSEVVNPAVGEQWYRYEFQESHAKLVFFQLELMDRDDVPADVAIFRVAAGKLEEFTEGQDPVAQPHEVQALAGNKFAPRILREAGTYYVRVRANHPEYKLRTRVYDPPPYSDPRVAVRTAVDYVMGAGDSWFANTPRRGGALDRVAGVHQETSLCVACHASHFSQRAQLYATAQGYAVVQRQQLQFLEERFYNNPRPFYGFEAQGAVWARVISAPANVLSRMSVLTGLFEANVSGAARPEYHDRISAYLKLYYEGRDKLPADETNGNTPLVSAHEVAWYAWKTTQDARLPGMIAQGEVKNMVDLCYQTLALAEIDRAKYAGQLRANAERILGMQRASGQWSMKFDAKEAEVEFQTGHALWALAAAGIPAEHPQVKKAIGYLLGRQQGFGGWMDPLQAFENFKTPFRETQMAVLALSAYFPMPARAKGWDAPAPERLSADAGKLLVELDGIWERPSRAVLAQIDSAARSKEVLVRQAAVEALGRLALGQSVPLVTGLLEDPSKLVQRTAAWALRQMYGAHPEMGSNTGLPAALGSPNVRLRWGATRVFAHHFAALAVRKPVVNALLPLVKDAAPAVRMQAIRGLWQAWFWNADAELRGKIEDALLGALLEPQHAWVESNLEAAIYNLADENIRYLYNNWVALLGRPEDRERAIQGRLSVEAQLAGKFAAVLERGEVEQKKRLLRALAELPLRRGDVYELHPADADGGVPVYSRIGNDIEQIAFFGSSAAALARALLPLIDAADPEMRRLARNASLIVRETTYAQVERAAGGRNESTLELAHRLDAQPESAEVARAFHLPAPKNAAPQVKAPAAVTAPLDEAVFHATVQPILEKKGADGYACTHCHSTHTLFNATWSTVKNVIDRADPENSLLLRKPTSTAESEGVANAAATAHGGGQRWQKGSAEYEAILQWIEGRR